MRPEFEFNYEGSVNASCGKSLSEKKRLAESCVRIVYGSDVEVIVIDPEDIRGDLERLMPYRETLGEATEKKERKENAE